MSRIADLVPTLFAARTAPTPTTASFVVSAFGGKSTDRLLEPQEIGRSRASYAAFASDQDGFGLAETAAF